MTNFWASYHIKEMDRFVSFSAGSLILIWLLTTFTKGTLIEEYFDIEYAILVALFAESMMKLYNYNIYRTSKVYMKLPLTIFEIFNRRFIKMIIPPIIGLVLIILIPYFKGQSYNEGVWLAYLMLSVLLYSFCIYGDIKQASKIGNGIIKETFLVISIFIAYSIILLIIAMSSIDIFSMSLLLVTYYIAATYSSYFVFLQRMRT